MADIQQTTNKQHRMLKISILRFNPQDPESVPHMQTYELEESDSMTLFIALNELRDTQDPTLQFDFVCRAGICGSCAMMINGKPGLACRTLTRDLPTEFTLAPLPAFERGCCIAGCGTVRIRPDFVGGVGIHKIARFRLDPRDTRNDADYYDIVGDESGVFGCMSLLACHDFCPKELPLKTQIAFIRRKMAEQGMRGYDKVLPTQKKAIPIKPARQ